MTIRSVSRKVCVVKECFDPVHGNSMCAKHLSRFRKHGDVMYGNDRKIVRSKGYTLEDRFWSKVNKDGAMRPNMTTQCWDFVSGGTSKRYGLFSFQGEQDGAHRWSYRIEHKLTEIPEGLQVCHKCDNTLCVRPDHLFLGTPLQNMQDKDAKGRGNYTAWRLEKPERQPRGERVNTAKLTAQDVINIRTRRGDGEPLLDIADDYNITRTQVSRIYLRQAWKHI